MIAINSNVFGNYNNYYVILYTVHWTFTKEQALLLNTVNTAIRPTPHGTTCMNDNVN